MKDVQNQTTNQGRPARGLKVFVILVALVLLNGSVDKGTAKQTKPPKKEGGMTTLILPLKKPGTVLIAAVGDILMHASLQRTAAAKENGFDNQFSRISRVLQHADVTFANLESPIADSVLNTGRLTKEPTRRYDGRVYSGYPMFNAHSSLAASMKKAGIDVVQTANNHTLDRQWRGIDRTIDALKASALQYTGTRHTENLTAPFYTISRINGFKIAWLGCTYGTNDIPDRHGQVLFCYKHQSQVLALINALAKRSDIHAVILTPHWGAEYVHAPDSRQKKLARAALDAGASAVIGTHPHVLQPFETYKTKDGRNGFIAYSLGNFISGQGRLPRRSSIVLFLELKRGKGGILEVGKIRYLPTHVLRTTNGFFVQPAGADDRSLLTVNHILRILPEAAMLRPKVK